ncbi:MAG: TIGR03960 family B12-binding radical SAM protein [Planctomycetes bacterium]|nr:TIGR03960 family B12-binding radical SAM protein [Planctomycetota bacterium]
MAATPPTLDDTAWGHLLRSVQMPGRYIGGEINQIVKDCERVDTRWALIYPDVYEIGMPHQGLRILYHCLNEHEDIWAERCFTPWADMEAALREHDTPLCTLESQTPLCALDVIGFTLQTELNYTNLLTTLDLGGIPLLAKDRDADAPLIVAGGAGVLNPEPVADFIDLFFLGDGEESVVAFSHALARLRKDFPQDRAGLLRALVEECPFLYAPRFWEPEFKGPALASMKPIDGVKTPRRAIVYDLENAPYPTAPVLPSVRTIHDRITIEIMRGCVEGCRFCQAGMEKRPQRFRSPERILEIARASYRNTGFNEIGLTSLSSSDHPQILSIMDTLNREFQSRRVSIAMPSLRVNDEIKSVVTRMADVRKHGLTLAPEVATDRLRNIINKGIKDDDLYQGAHQAWKLGYTKMKLYFMMGIPSETREDLLGIVKMAERVSFERKNAGCGGLGQVKAAVSTFIPKALTPFQWHAQRRPEWVKETKKQLWDWQRLRAVKIQCHTSGESLIEGYLSRADRRAGAVILSAWKAGARFDAWSREFRMECWEEAWAEHGYTPEETCYRARPMSEVFPWDHLDLGVTRAYLEKEWQRARDSVLTDHCQTGACSTCGVGASLCVDIKALAGFEKYARPKLIERANTNPLFALGDPDNLLEPLEPR